jgi:hypothetical protein
MTRIQEEKYNKRFREVDEGYRGRQWFHNTIDILRDMKDEGLVNTKLFKVVARQAEIANTDLLNESQRRDIINGDYSEEDDLEPKETVRYYQNNSQRFGEIGVVVTEKEMIQQIRNFSPWEEEQVIREDIRRALVSGELVEL